VTRRASLPGAAELFRPTSPTPPVGPPAQIGHPVPTVGHQPVSLAESDQPHGEGSSGRGSSGRCRHDAKITVYLSDEELLALEQARLALRALHGLAVDRGRVVREAIATALAELAERGEESQLVRRLRREPCQ